MLHILCPLLASTLKHPRGWCAVKNRREIDGVGIWVVERVSLASVGTVVLDETGGPIGLPRVARTYVVEV